MQTRFTVVLQDGMHFSVIWLIIAAVLAAAAACLWIYLRRYRRKLVEQGVWKTGAGSGKAETQIEMPALKDKYIRKLRESSDKFKAGTISPRTAAQEISLTVRTFLYEQTGKPVHRYTLREIEKSRLKEIGTHIGMLYEPEFAPEEETDKTILKLYRDAERIIKRW